MKKKNLFKSKTQMIIYTLLFLICISLFIVISKTDFTKHLDTDAERFHEIYPNVPVNNVYEFSNASEVLAILNGKSGVILCGFAENIWTDYAAEILNNAAITLGLDKIYYYDFLSDREQNNGTYETLVNKLGSYINTFDKGTRDLQAPTVIVVKKGKVIGFFDETSIMKTGIKPSKYYDDTTRQNTFEMYKSAIMEIR